MFFPAQRYINSSSIFWKRNLVPPLIIFPVARITQFIPLSNSSSSSEILSASWYRNKVAEHHSYFVADLIFKQSESGRGFVCRVTGVVCTPRYLPPPPPRRPYFPRLGEERERESPVCLDPNKKLTLPPTLPPLSIPFLRPHGRPSCWEETRPTVTWPSRGLQGHDGGVGCSCSLDGSRGGEFRWRSKLRRGVLLPKGGLTRRKGEGRWFSCEERKKKRGKERGRGQDIGEGGWTLGWNEQKERLIPTCYPEEETVGSPVIRHCFVLVLPPFVLSL